MWVGLAGNVGCDRDRDGHDLYGDFEGIMHLRGSARKGEC